jgi:hypothetical protein
MSHRDFNQNGGLMRGVFTKIGSTALLVLVVITATSPQFVYAGGLKDTVKNLYGGDGIILQPTPPPFPSHAPHFTASSLQGLDTLGGALASSVGLLSFNSTVTGFTFDIERGVPVRTTESLGPLISERAPTLGARRLNLAFSYTRADFRRFEGKGLGNLGLSLVHEDVNGDGILGPAGTPFEFELDQIRVDLDLKIQQDVFALFATYGLTRTWDIGVVLPIVHVRFRADAFATIVRNSAISGLVHNFGPQSDPRRSRGGGDKTGIGDIIVRTKYNFLRDREGWPDSAIVGQVKLPTGDEDNLLGTGETNFLALFVASKSFGPASETRWLTPHLNLGFELSTAGSKQHNVRYVAGFDARVLPSLTLAVDGIGRWEPKGDGIGDHTVDLALGVKWNLIGSFLTSANVQVPLNRREGLRANVIWGLGVEYTF